MATVFLITPFSSESAGKEPLVVFEQVQNAVREAARIAGVQLVHPKEIQEAGVIMDQVDRQLELADIVIAILTGKNPNVFLELGRARCPKILIADSEESVPFDLRHFRYLTYSAPNALEGLAQNLAASIQQTLSELTKRTWDDLLRRAQKQRTRFEEQTTGNIDKLKSYIPQVYVSRTTAEERLQAFLSSDRAALILVGASGFGLTNLLCHWIEQRKAAGDCVFVYNCRPWTHRYIEEELAIGFEVTNRSELLAAFQRLAKQASEQSQLVLLIFEDIDDFCADGRVDPANLLKQIDALVEGINGLSIRIVVSCHTPAWERLKRSGIMDDMRMSLYFQPAGAEAALHLDRFSPDEFSKAYDVYRQFFSLSTDSAELTPDVRERLRNPILLHLFACVYKGRPEPFTHEAPMLRLFKRYYEVLVLPNDRQFAEAVAKEMLDRRQMSLSLYELGENPKLAGELDGENSSYFRLLRNGVLVEIGDDENKRVIFAQPQVAAYALSSSLLNRKVAMDQFVDFVLQQARESSLGWYASRLLLNDKRELFAQLAKSNDIELRELAIEGLLQIYEDFPESALKLIEDLLQLDSRQARQTALKAAYCIGPAAREIFRASATHSSRAIRQSAADMLYLIWCKGGKGADFTVELLRDLTNRVTGLTALLALPRTMRFLIQLTITIYMNHCEREDVKQLIAELYLDLLKNKLHIDRLGAIPEIFSGAVAGAFSRPILDSVLLGDIAGKEFFQAPDSEKSLLKGMTAFLDPESDIQAHEDELLSLLSSSVHPSNVLGAMLLAVHAYHSFDAVEPMLRRLFTAARKQSPLGRFWILAAFSVLLPDAPRAWTELLEYFTRTLIEDDPEVFYSDRLPALAKFEIVMLPLGLAYAKEQKSMPYFQQLLTDGIQRGDLRCVRRCISGLGPIGFYYPNIVFHTLRDVGVDFNSVDLQDSLTSALAIIHTLHMDEVDAFLDAVDASDELGRRVASQAGTEEVRNYILLLGLYNNAVHQALKYPKMRRGLLMNGFNLLADSRRRSDFVSRYTTDGLRMLRSADYNLIHWTEGD